MKGFGESKDIPKKGKYSLFQKIQKIGNQVKLKA